MSIGVQVRESLSVGAMTADEVATLVGWAAAEGWNPGRHDADVAWRDQPDAFVALRLDGELIGGATVMAYDATWGFLGLFLVREDLRGRGRGTVLWQRLLAHLDARLTAPGATIGLDGVFDRMPYYERSGFVAAYRDLRFEGRPTADADPHVAVGLGVTLDDAALDEALSFDEAHAVGPRRTFMRAWLTAPVTQVATLHRDGVLVGLGAMRPCREGVKLGPVLAASPSDAERIITSLVAKAGGQLVQLDVPEPNEAGAAIAARLGLTESFGCARMYRGRVPALPVERIYGVTSFEFG